MIEKNMIQLSTPLSEVIDIDWVMDNPGAVIDLLQCYEHELKYRKDYIKTLEEQLELSHKKDFLSKVIAAENDSLEIIE